MFNDFDESRITRKEAKVDKILAEAGDEGKIIVHILISEQLCMLVVTDNNFIVGQSCQIDVFPNGAVHRIEGKPVLVSRSKEDMLRRARRTEKKREWKKAARRYKEINDWFPDDHESGIKVREYLEYL